MFNMYLIQEKCLQPHHFLQHLCVAMVHKNRLRQLQDVLQENLGNLCGPLHKIQVRWCTHCNEMLTLNLTLFLGETYAVASTHITVTLHVLSLALVTLTIALAAGGSLAFVQTDAHDTGKGRCMSLHNAKGTMHITQCMAIHTQHTEHFLIPISTFFDICITATVVLSRIFVIAYL